MWARDETPGYVIWGAMRRMGSFLQLTWNRFEILCSHKDKTIWQPYCLLNAKQLFNVYNGYRDLNSWNITVNGVCVHYIHSMYIRLLFNICMIPYRPFFKNTFMIGKKKKYATSKRNHSDY